MAGEITHTTPVLFVTGPRPHSHEASYRSAIRHWEADGYDLRWFPWSAVNHLAAQKEALLETVEAMPDHLLAIGVSVGALAVLSAFGETSKELRKLVTLAAPLNVTQEDLVRMRTSPRDLNPGMSEALYYEADTFLSTTGVNGLAKIVSVHGRSDSVVLPRWSQRPGIESCELALNGHSKVIKHALTGRYQQKLKSLLEV